jgi:pyruvate,water dikinase
VETGGKARSLEWLSAAGFQVPRWIVLGPDERPEALEGKLRAEFGERWMEREFAVRSSVADEDGDKHSFAGQMESFLFQSGLQAIRDSTEKVRESARSSRALSYRRQSGLTENDIRVAVIVQEMVDGEVSGVLFTAHPVTGERDRALISACYGAGDGVVSGACECDEFSVDAGTGNIESRINEKPVRSVRAPHGVRLDPVPEGKRRQSCLTEAQVLELARYGRRIAVLRGRPQDVEWTIREGRIYFLQARPITKLPPRSAGVASSVVFDNSNIQESYCGVTTPLTFSFANRCYFEVYRQLMAMMGFSAEEVKLHDRRHRELLGLINGRVYYNINNWYRGLLFLPSFGRNKADMEKMMGLTEPVDFVEDFKPGWVAKLATLPKLLGTLCRLLGAFARIDARVARFEKAFAAKYRGIDREKLQLMDGRALCLKAEEVVDRFLGEWDTPIINDFFVMMMNGKVVRRLKRLGLESEMMSLLAGEELASLAPTRALLALADEVRSSQWLEGIFAAYGDADLLSALSRKAPRFEERCREFIELYGDRCIGELKLESLSMREDPSFVFAVIRNYLENPALSSATFQARESESRARAESRVFTRIRHEQGSIALWRFKRDLAKVRKAVRYRESMRLARTRVFGLFRTLYLEIGQRLAELGAVAEPRDVFYLTTDEIDRYFAGTSVQARLQPIVASRREEFTAYEKDDPGHRIEAATPVYVRSGWKGKDSGGARSDQTLRGTGCFPGVVKESVRLVFSPQGNLDLKNKILCTVRTDPGWTPLFASISGLLVERGSTLSHSAVVAREMGVPAIVGIPGLTELLEDGEVVFMDGVQGTVQREGTLTQ